MLFYPVATEDKTYNTFKSLGKFLNIEAMKLKCLESLIALLREDKIPDLTCMLSQIDTLFVTQSFQNEDFEAYYVTMIKFLLRNINQAALNTFYNTSQKSFPILKPLLYYSHHPDLMIKNAARIGLMAIFQKCTGKTMKYITTAIIPEYVSHIILHLKRNALDIQNFSEKCNSAALKRACQYYEEELEYIDDILTLNNAIKSQIILGLIDDFIISFILPAIICTKVQKEPSLIICKVALYLLIKILENITDIDVREIVINFILEEKVLKQDFTKTQFEYKKDFVDSLKVIITKNEFHTEVVYILYLFHIIQTNVRDNREKIIKFYDNILIILIKILAFNKQANYDTKCIKSNLLLLTLKPLTLEKELSGNPCWLKLQTFLSESLKILYSSICKEFKHKEFYNLVSVIDGEYKKFIKNELDNKRIFNDVSCFLLEKNTRGDKKSVLHTALNNLFLIRYLCLNLTGQEERILPILKAKEKIGSVLNTNDCVPCKKLIHTNIYDDKHFLKLTDRQLLLIQNIGHRQESNGIVIFSSYYKDITWSESANNTMIIYETYRHIQFNLWQTQKPLCFQLKFHNFKDLNFTEKFLTNARNLQVQVIKRKLEDFLEM